MPFEVTGRSGLLTRKEIAGMLTALAHSAYMSCQPDGATRDLDYLRGYFNALQNIGEAVGVGWTGGRSRFPWTDDALDIHNGSETSHAIIHAGTGFVTTTEK